MIKVITNLIADGGISSKNSPNYSIESFLISKNKNYTFAIKSDVYQTKDNVFILLDDEIKKKLAINNSYIKSRTYCQLKKLNIGNKVKKHLIVSLNELINISNNQDNIISDGIGGNIFSTNINTNIPIYPHEFITSVIISCITFLPYIFITHKNVKQSTNFYRMLAK